MDKTDLKLLGLLMQNARMPLNQLAKEVSLSSPAAAARIERLQRDGVITGFSAQVDHQKLGLPIMAFINLAMPPKMKPTFYPFIKACPNVLDCNYVTGSYTMLIKTAFESTQALDAFVGQLQEFGETRTHIVFSNVLERPGVLPEKQAASGK